MTSLDLFANGFPLKPPDSFIFFEVKLSLFIVVLVAIIPSIFRDIAKSTISKRFSLDKSGDILIKIGLVFDFFKFSLFRESKITLRKFVFCSSLRLGVFGELTFTTK